MAPYEKTWGEVVELLKPHVQTLHLYGVKRIGVGEQLMRALVAVHDERAERLGMKAILPADGNVEKVEFVWHGVHVFLESEA